KIYYTLDGSEPDVYSAMYNPSTYQPELNTPIEVTGDMTVRAFASGYGRADSPVAEFRIEVEE
ncbi:MAG: chitobiase/beta-hexosaminidase C-terminal domain-containing protein, partial [Firmicutes bacterium]|nr:chitobiase/beta-hexosaminidase C-terminal domain-containing protein [Bacillota bacterium]